MQQSGASADSVAPRLYGGGPIWNSVVTLGGADIRQLRRSSTGRARSKSSGSCAISESGRLGVGGELSAPLAQLRKCWSLDRRGSGTLARRRSDSRSICSAAPRERKDRSLLRRRRSRRRTAPSRQEWGAEVLPGVHRERGQAAELGRVGRPDGGVRLFFGGFEVGVGPGGVVGDVDDLVDLGHGLGDGHLDPLAERDGGHAAALASAA
jgi:hypothetical protein